MSPEDRARRAAERRGDLERQPLLVAREDMVGERWMISGVLELFGFGYGATEV